jgi:triacylglycerol lipase
MGGYNYWGGRDDIARVLTNLGHETRVAVVGPVASNWDRACELYAYIKGGRVDYGAAHAQRYGHQRFGRTFPGLYPDWGQTGAHARVHLVGHSQGGQTIRVLAWLLSNGDPSEQLAAPVGGLHPLFKGGQPELVRSVTTLASPHDGTTLATVLNRGAGYLLNWLLALAGHLSRDQGPAPPYDFKLDQWQLARNAGEADEDYRQRLADADVWDQPDISIHDLRPEGAMKLNGQYPAVDSIYYFSWAAQDNRPGPRGKGYQPAIGMNLALISTSLAISTYENREPTPGLPAFAEAWWPNDGVVNTVSMSGPKLGSRDRIINLAPDQDYPPFMPGIWHFLGVKEGWDHLDIVGQQTRLDYRTFYLDMARLLAALPAETTEFEKTTHAAGAAREEPGIGLSY